MPPIPSRGPFFIIPAGRIIGILLFVGIAMASLFGCIHAAGGEGADGGIGSSTSQLALVEGYASGADPVEVIIIISPGCPKCAAAERTLEKVGQTVPLNVSSYYYYTDEGHRIIDQLNARDIPAIIIGTEVIDYRDYGGDASILENKALRALHNQSQRSETAPSIGFPGNTSPIQRREDALPGYDLQDLSLSTALAVTAGGFVAGFNPCLFGILVFLAASILSTSGKRRELIMMVVFFSFGIFSMYFLFGLGMQRLLHSEAIAATFRFALSVLILDGG